MKNQIQTLQQKIAAYSALEDFVGYQFLQRELIALQNAYIEMLEQMVFERTDLKQVA